MSISGIESNNAINTLSLKDSTKSKAIKTDNSEEISDNFSESVSTQKFKEIVGKYDITAMSRNEACQMYKDLYDNGLVSLKDLMFATFDPTRQIEDIKKATGMNIGSSINVSGWEISCDPDKKMNFLEGFKIQSEWNKKYGDPKFQHNYDETLALAEKIRYFQA